MYYKILVNYSSKPCGRPKNGTYNDYQRTHDEEEKFKTLKEVEYWLKEHLPNKPKEYIYHDEEENTQPIGLIYRYRATEYDCSEGRIHYLAEDWVTITRVEEKPLKSYKQFL